MGKSQTSDLLLTVSKLAEQCNLLLPRVEKSVGDTDKINRLKTDTDKLKRELMGGAKRSRAEIARKLKEADLLQCQIDQLFRPFDEVRQDILAFFESVRDTLRHLPLDDEFVRTRDDLGRISAPYVGRPRFLVSVNRARADLRVVKTRLADLTGSLSSNKTSNRQRASSGARSPVSKGKRGPGRKPIKATHQKKLAEILSPHLDNDEWLEPEILTKICQKLDRAKVPGPSDRSWQRILEDDLGRGKRNAVNNIRYRLYKASDPAIHYLPEPRNQ